MRAHDWHARGYRRSSPPSGRASATTAAPPQTSLCDTARAAVARHPYSPVTDTLLRGPVESEQYTSFAFTQVLDDYHVLASIGTVGDAYDNAMAESFVDSFKTELIADRVWRTRSQLELAIVEYVSWFNHQRLHQSLGDLPPAEVETRSQPGSFNIALS
jgi:putative transposase